MFFFLCPKSNAVTNLEALRQTVAEGGGVRIFETGIQYRVLELSR